MKHPWMPRDNQVKACAGLSPSSGRLAATRRATTMARAMRVAVATTGCIWASSAGLMCSGGWTRTESISATRTKQPSIGSSWMQAAVRSTPPVAKKPVQSFFARICPSKRGDHVEQSIASSAVPRLLPSVCQCWCVCGVSGAGLDAGKRLVEETSPLHSLWRHRGLSRVQGVWVDHPSAWWR
jgi:hypothetical protein